MIKCGICGGPLQMKADGDGAVCALCGVSYPIELLRRMAGQVRAEDGPSVGTNRPSDPAIAQPMKKASAPAPASDGFLSEYAVRAPDLSGRPLRKIQNERFGLALSEHRSLSSFLRPEPVPPMPQRPGVFAPKAQKEDYQRRMAEWEATSLRHATQNDAISDYYLRFYETTQPEYSKEEWKPYFEEILRENFPEYELRMEVPTAKLFPGTPRAGIKATFVLVREGRAALAIYLSPNAKRLQPAGCKTCLKHGLPALTFYTVLSNRRDYVIDRVRRALNN